MLKVLWFLQFLVLNKINKSLLLMDMYKIYAYVNNRVLACVFIQNIHVDFMCVCTYGCMYVAFRQSLPYQVIHLFISKSYA